MALHMHRAFHLQMLAWKLDKALQVAGGEKEALPQLSQPGA